MFEQWQATIPNPHAIAHPHPTPPQCVVMAGLVWNAPLSCAWAGRVYVSDREARDHGLSHVGLPSRLAAFQSAPAQQPSPRAERRAAAASWWRKGRAAAPDRRVEQQVASTAGLTIGGPWVDAIEVRSLEKGRRALDEPVATFKVARMKTEGFLGPRLRLSLPSFRCVFFWGGGLMLCGCGLAELVDWTRKHRQLLRVARLFLLFSNHLAEPHILFQPPCKHSGGTAEHPALLKYSCDLQTNVMPVTPLSIHLHHDVTGSGDTSDAKRQQQQQQQQQQRGWWPWGPRDGGDGRADGGEVIDKLLCGRPLVALAFSNMVMKVEEPTRLEQTAATAQPARSRAAMLAMVPPAP